MKLVKIQDNTSRKLTNVDLLVGTVYGNNIPLKFIPGRMYNTGDRVYVENTDGTVSVKECINGGIYTDTNGTAWVEFTIKSEDGLVGHTDYSEFRPDVFEVGDRQVIINDDGSAMVYECIVPGNYTEITSDGWQEIKFIPGGNSFNKTMLDGMLLTQATGYISAGTYSPLDMVYIVNPDGSIFVYVHDGDSDTKVDPPNSPWVMVDISSVLPLPGSLNGSFATDEDIKNMFGKTIIPDVPVDPDDPVIPDDPDDDGPVWEDF